MQQKLTSLLFSALLGCALAAPAVQAAHHEGDAADNNQQEAKAEAREESKPVDSKTARDMQRESNELACRELGLTYPCSTE